MNDYEAHLSSYDHSHKQRLKDMKAMVRDPSATARARRAEAKADGVVSIKLANQDAPTTTGGAGFKKGGFKKTGFKNAFAPVENATPSGSENKTSKPTAPAPAERLVNPALQKKVDVESDTEDEGYEVYDPRYPTD